VLAAMVFVARIAMDSLNTLIQKFGRAGLLGYRIVSVAAIEQPRWRAVLETINFVRK
jgi:hypothetical protein